MRLPLSCQGQGQELGQGTVVVVCECGVCIKVVTDKERRVRLKIFIPTHPLKRTLSHNLETGIMMWTLHEA
jgi:hypothetical protein